MVFVMFETTQTRSEKAHPISIGTKQHGRRRFFPLHESINAVSYPGVLFSQRFLKYPIEGMGGKGSLIPILSHLWFSM